MTLLQLFDHHDSEQITSVINELREKMTGEFVASQLLQKLDNSKKPFTADHWLLLLPVAMISMVLIIGLILFTVWRKCCAQSQEPTVSPQSICLSIHLHQWLH